MGLENGRKRLMCALSLYPTPLFQPRVMGIWGDFLEVIKNRPDAIAPDLNAALNTEFKKPLLFETVEGSERCRCCIVAQCWRIRREGSPRFIDRRGNATIGRHLTHEICGPVPLGIGEVKNGLGGR